MNCPRPIRQAGAHGSCWQTPRWASNWGSPRRRFSGCGSAPSVLEEDGDKAALLDALTGTENVLYAPSVPSAHLDVASGYRLFNAVRRLAATLAGMASPPKLVILTRNAQPIDEGDRANPAHAVLWGLGRTLALEHPEIWRAIIDVDDSVPPELIAHYVRAEVRAADGEDQVVYRAGVRHVPRLERRTPPVSLTGLEGDTSHLVSGLLATSGQISSANSRRWGPRRSSRCPDTRARDSRNWLPAWRREGRSSLRLLPMRRTKPR